MTQFDERERAFEAKFGRDEEAEFRMAVRAAKLFGLWAAQQMSMKDAEVEAYAEQMADLAVAKPGHEHLMKKAEQDFAGKGVNFTRHRIEREFADCERQAQKVAEN